LNMFLGGAVQTSAPTQPQVRKLAPFMRSC
jgi:hypothetical protein